MNISLRDWLNLLRNERDLTLAELGEALGYTAEGVRRYAGRGNQPPQLFADALVDFLKLSAEQVPEFSEFVCGAKSDVSRPVADWILDLAQPGLNRRARGNLPQPLTRLLGRDEDIERLSRLLSTRDVRLLTLTGSAGTGKTRMAIAVAERMREVCYDGVYFVDLSPFFHPRGIDRAIADVLRLGDAVGRNTIQTLVDYLAARRMLLVLDNLEQLVDPPDLTLRGIGQRVIGELLQSAPQLKVLATSRVKLRVDGERVRVVQPLRLPTAGQKHNLRLLAANPAVALFIDRARNSREDFRLTAANAGSLAGLCRYLEGIPLAIELAAAQCDRRDPAAIYRAVQEESRLIALVDGPLDRGSRHHTLRAAIATSFNLLDAPRQRFFAQLGVFVGGCTEAAAASVCGGGSSTATREILRSLVDASLLHLVDQPQSHYVMLETLREFALDELRASGDLEATSRRHAMHYVELCERIEPELIGRDQAVWLAVCEAEHENVRAALRWLIQNDDLEAAARLASALWRFWWTRGHLTDGRFWLDSSLPARQRLPTRVSARLLTGDGILARTQRDFDRANDSPRRCRCGSRSTISQEPCWSR